MGLAVGELIELGHLDVEVGAGTRDKRAIGSVPHRREPYSNRQGNRAGEAKGGIKEGCGFEQWHDIEPLQQCTGRGGRGGREGGGRSQWIYFDGCVVAQCERASQGSRNWNSAITRHYGRGIYQNLKRSAL